MKTSKILCLGNPELVLVKLYEYLPYYDFFEITFCMANTFLTIRDNEKKILHGENLYSKYVKTLYLMTVGCRI